MSTPCSAAMLVVLVGIAAMGMVVPPVEGGRAFFVFGDSLFFLDVYNIGQAIGEESTLAYFNPELKGEKLLVGANFASAGIGILNDTGFQFANIIRIHKQLRLFREYQRRVSALIGEEQTQTLVNKALVLVTLGGNDFVNNYFLTPITLRRLQYNLHDYSRLLVSEYKSILLVIIYTFLFFLMQLQELYNSGARRVLVTGTGPIGCVPAEVALRGVNGQCAVEPQRAAAIYNPLLTEMLAGLNQEIGSNVFIAAKAFEKQYDFINNPKAFGLFYNVEEGLLWAGSVQWDWTLYCNFKSVQE
ncbi:PREDICTED: GDSL esterase/lipase At4g28780 [Erythranthe guttata]|uniref:GDSL esterase/lipase At4g28780 n=1 Tax=Erythranthe guttata TaxID=4155 RepID=UPI00064D74E5|nr:PREDICTED: GDSL esterase/lipase At4g28780 [Erythranthe guttata]|eukprot:XP_012835777.1 PREDICTED: GDSL esterase/lipase At4g28780 [Erythranthe guttata]